MTRRRRIPEPDPDPDPDPPPDDRAWSARTNLHERDVGKDDVRYTPLPAETGPTWAPDELSIWPVEGGRFGIDAHYHGATGAERAAHQVERLGRAGLVATTRPASHGGSILRLGPLAHGAAWVALEAFLGRPLQLGS
ncbi:MAG TPA: hypothetical protein VGR11_12075 [Solirubrobacteraceae bacterium]|nr:hypothetical protein [Solirubrobacteraceae bacterium]